MQPGLKPGLRSSIPIFLQLHRCAHHSKKLVQKSLLNKDDKKGEFPDTQTSLKILELEVDHEGFSLPHKLLEAS